VLPFLEAVARTEFNVGRQRRHEAHACNRTSTRSRQASMALPVQWEACPASGPHRVCWQVQRDRVRCTRPAAGDSGTQQPQAPSYGERQPARLPARRPVTRRCGPAPSPSTSLTAWGPRTSPKKTSSPMSSPPPVPPRRDAGGAGGRHGSSSLQHTSGQSYRAAAGVGRDTVVLGSWDAGCAFEEQRLVRFVRRGVNAGAVHFRSCPCSKQISRGYCLGPAARIGCRQICERSEVQAEAIRNGQSAPQRAANGSTRIYASTCLCPCECECSVYSYSNPSTPSSATLFARFRRRCRSARTPRRVRLQA